MWKLLLVPVFLYLALLLLVFVFQARLLFPAGAVGAPPGPLPPGTDRLGLEAEDGNRLHGVHIPPGAARSGTLILGFGGNAWNAESAAAYLHGIFPEATLSSFTIAATARRRAARPPTLSSTTPRSSTTSP